MFFRRFLIKNRIICVKFILSNILTLLILLIQVAATEKRIFLCIVDTLPFGALAVQDPYDILDADVCPVIVLDCRLRGSIVKLLSLACLMKELDSLLHVLSRLIRKALRRRKLFRHLKFRHPFDILLQRVQIA